MSRSSSLKLYHFLTETYHSRIHALFITARPAHWIKNAFVCAPLIFSGRFTQAGSCIKSAMAFLSFCMVSSAVYAINDLCDRREDRLHPVKKHRPVAVGSIESGTAIIFATALFALSINFACFANRFLIPVILLFTVINIAYSLGIKHIAILDVLMIAFGFVLRVVGGSIAISVVPSYWLILCTMMISMFLGFTKRRVELLNIDCENGDFRPVLKDYSVDFLDRVIPIMTGATIISYALYTVDTHTQAVLGSRAMLITVPFVIYGVLRYIYIIYHLKKDFDPTDILISDAPTVINLLLWALVSLLVVKYGGSIIYFW